MKVLAFGDSFVKMFIHCEPEVKHWKFKGKSVRGLIKDDDLQRKRIQKQIRKAPNGTKVIFIFGQVDFNYVRYYKIIKGEPPISEQTFKKYIQWVNSINFRKNISIISIFPSPIKKQFVINSLINKGSYLIQNQTPEIDSKILAQFDRSQETWYLWNSWISSYCQKYRVNNIRLFQKNYLEPQFYDLSRLTVHLRYVPVLKLVKKYFDISFNAEKAQQIQKQYEMEKTNRIANSNFKINGQKQQPDLQINKEIQRKCSLEDQIRNLQNPRLINTSSSNDKQSSKQNQIQQVQCIKNVRKQTADLDTDTNLQKQIEHQREIQKKKNSSGDDQLIEETQVNSDQSQKQKKKNKKKTKKYKQKQKQKQKQKKKYICVEKSEESEDQGERFLLLSTKNKRNY